MYKWVSLLLLVTILMFWTVDETIYANSNDKPQPLEESYSEIGYKTVDEALSEFEKHFNQNVKLPLRVPPINFTHYFGRFNDFDDEINDSFEIEFISDKSPENHYKIDVRPIKHKIPFKDKEILKVYKLKHGKNAMYTKVSGFNILVFERDNWQYMLSVDRRVSNKVTAESLVQIANSIDYSTELNKNLFTNGVR